MSDQAATQHFDLERFVLGYLEHEGSLATPPAYGVHEVLLPDALAASLHVDPYLNLAFDAQAAAAAVRLSVNHPLVEAIAERALQEDGYAQVALNHVRLEKRGLFDLAAKTWNLPNARPSPVREANEQAALHHYLTFNFKATFLSDEKQEQIVAVVMDGQAGHAITDAEHRARLISAETQTAFTALPTARPRWSAPGDVLAPGTLAALLARAAAAAEKSLSARLQTLQARTQRFLELDLARLEDYYDSLERDLKQRLARVEDGDPERRKSTESKLDALAVERRAKLADVQARHGIRVDLELINVLVTVQPKVTLPVTIANRRVTVTRLAVWDPLLHRIEPLVCDRCGEPGADLHLCTGGHLAHSHCLAPQCIECNRVYCQLCADQVLTCAVCHQPVCRVNSRVCSDCGRITCGEHQKLCHGAAGQPVVLPKEPAAAAATPPPPAASKPEPARKLEPTRRAPSAKPPAPPPALVSPAPAAPTVKAVKLYVQIETAVPRVVCFVMRSTRRVLATRAIELTPAGIQVSCQCEKHPCPADGWLHRPMPASMIQDQVQKLIAALREEYFLPGKRVDYHSLHDGQVTELPGFNLPACWRDEGALTAARQQFDARPSLR